MDFLKNQAAKIREQLSGLSSSQKMLAGALVVIMMMTLLWWSKFAGSSEMEAVLEQDFSADDLTRVTALIASRNIPYKVVGNRVNVSTDRKFEVLAMLGYEQLLPSDTAKGFDSIIEKMDSPWNTSEKQAVVFNRAKEVTLAQVLRAFPGIRNATVVIDNTAKRAFGEAARQPSATVNLQTKNTGDKASKKLINAAADVVAGAVSGMQRSRINVIVDGASYNAQDRDSEGGLSGGDTWMEQVKESERHFSEKIAEHLRYIEGIMVSVSVDPSMEVKRIERETYDKLKTLTIPINTTEKSIESSNSSKPAGEPGAVPNTLGGSANKGADLGSSATTEGTTSTETENTTKMQVLPSVVREWLRTPAGAAAVTGAGVSVPRSHFVKIFKSINPAAKDPDDATLLPLVTTELMRIKNAVKACVSQTAEEKIVVDWYYDYVPSSGPDGSPVAAASSMPLSIAGHTKEIALGTLALMSLFMVMMMVRKSTPPAIIPPKVEKAIPAPQPQGEDVAGEVGEGTQSLEAVEVDASSIQTQQIISQVSTMVKENPDGAASLVKRWLSRA